MKRQGFQRFCAGDLSDPATRDKAGMTAGIVGIFTNLLLTAAKLVVGIFSGSISVFADAVNNLSDAAASVVTLAGFRIAQKPADEKHPYGHARSEYISGLLVAFLMVVIGIELLKGSVEKILSPTPVEFSLLTLLVLVAAIFGKLLLFFFYRYVGKSIASKTVLASSSDSLNDVITTFAVLLSALAAYFLGWQIDGYMGCAVSVFILISGVRVLKDTLNPLLGETPEPELVKKLEEEILQRNTVLGLHDLVVHNYGVGRCFASVHVEFSAKQDLLVSHDIIDNIEREVEAKLGVHLVIHLDPIVTDDPFTNEMREKAEKFVASIDGHLSIHDFRVVRGTTHTNLIFDITVPPAFSVPDQKLRELIEAFFSGISDTYFCVITIDRSFLPSV